MGGAQGSMGAITSGACGGAAFIRRMVIGCMGARRSGPTAANSSISLTAPFTTARPRP